MSDSIPPPPPYQPPPPPGGSSGYIPEPGYNPAAGYGAPAPSSGYGGGSIDHPKGTTVLVLGILGLVVCGILGIIAWVMGNAAIKEIDANPSYYRNRGTVNAGRICGIVATILNAIGLLFFIIVIIAAAGSSSSNF